MTLETLSQNRMYGGTQGVYSHQSSSTGTPMRFAVYQPPQAESGPLPVLWYLSGLTCTEENVTVKAGAQRYCAEHGLIFVAPDTSPRGAGIEGEDESYDFGTGAGFYVDATVAPWAKNYQMYSYIVDELPKLLFANFPAREDAQAITGHSMGGHGALTIGLKHPDTYRSVSAFSPICAPAQCDWGKKALGGYLGNDAQNWKDYDATQLIQAGKRQNRILVDQGEADEFLQEQLLSQVFIDACASAEQPLEFRMQPGYDHSYYFIATFMQDHVRFHADNLS